jgi:hypothetical protein
VIRGQKKAKKKKTELGRVQLANNFEIGLRRLLFLDRGILDQVDKILAYWVLRSIASFLILFIGTITFFNYHGVFVHINRTISKAKEVGWSTDVAWVVHFSFTSAFVHVGIAFFSYHGRDA